MTALATGAAPGKVILLGEHAAVYGRPALAAALGRGLGATAERDPAGPVLHIPAWDQHIRLAPDGHGGFESLSRAFAAALHVAGLDAAEQRQLAVTVDGELPPSVGLGSSAAFAVAVLRALGVFRGQPFSDPEMLAAALEVEKVFHGTPSGVDHTVATLGGCLRFQKGTTPPWRRVPLGGPVPLAVAFAPREHTARQMVEGLRDRAARLPGVYEGLFDTIAQVVDAGERALADGDLASLGLLFDLNHALLRGCGVSSPAIEQLVALARRCGALGAKLTGAGGGGAVIAILPGDPAPFLDEVERLGFQGFATVLDGP